MLFYNQPQTYREYPCKHCGELCQPVNISGSRKDVVCQDCFEKGAHRALQRIKQRQAEETPKHSEPK